MNKRYIIAAISFLVPFFVSAAERITRNARIDISGTKDKITFSNLKRPQQGHIKIINWGKKQLRPYNLTCEIYFKKQNLRNASFSFTPNKSGKINLSLTSRAQPRKAGRHEDRLWVYFSKVSVTGAKLYNGDFKKLESSGKPSRWLANNSVKVLVNNNKREIGVWHSGRCF